LRHVDGNRECLFIRVDRKLLGDGQNGAFDPILGLRGGAGKFVQQILRILQVRRLETSVNQT
jgi:hypothetical protein